MARSQCGQRRCSLASDPVEAAFPVDRETAGSRVGVSTLTEFRRYLLWQVSMARSHRGQRRYNLAWDPVDAAFPVLTRDRGLERRQEEMATRGAVIKLHENR